MNKNFYEMNSYLGDVLQRGLPHSILRIDNTAGYILDCMAKQRPINQQFFNPNTILEAGIYPHTYDNALNIYKMTYDCMLQIGRAHV